MSLPLPVRAGAKPERTRAIFDGEKGGPSLFLASKARLCRRAEGNALHSLPYHTNSRRGGRYLYTSSTPSSRSPTMHVAVQAPVRSAGATHNVLYSDPSRGPTSQSCIHHPCSYSVQADMHRLISAIIQKATPLNLGPVPSLPSACALYLIIPSLRLVFAPFFSLSSSFSVIAILRTLPTHLTLAHPGRVLVCLVPRPAAPGQA
ncbi:hypothetical protein B0T19DRAFT_430995 [Cercophora scortea]|uniref:Uncharacterized protein n=1 Tax=Cercophora scortea TaxID=314031 RepID=A0AAE0IAX1_9PEZI|nr:hypothetical protein B0T19DRAFT_430995 [Cercophora scortea]